MLLLAASIAAVYAADPPGGVLNMKASNGWQQRGHLSRPPGWSFSDRRPAVFLLGGGWKAPVTFTNHGQDAAEVPAGAVRFLSAYTRSIP